jgi:hypothetical protein
MALPGSIWKIMWDGALTALEMMWRIMLIVFVVIAIRMLLRLIR